MRLGSLRDLYREELEMLYEAEDQITKALPKMIKAASSGELQGALEAHLQKTGKHAERLEQIFDDMGASPRKRKCEGINGILQEASRLLGRDADEAVRDAGIITAAQKIEHYEIAAYGCARSHARMLGEIRASLLLERTLDEEKIADEKLTRIADRMVNRQAALAA
jgi:ferritin-like metal-binding protein YciE